MTLVDVLSLKFDLNASNCHIRYSIITENTRPMQDKHSNVCIRLVLLWYEIFSALFKPIIPANFSTARDVANLFL